MLKNISPFSSRSGTSSAWAACEQPWQRGGSHSLLLRTVVLGTNHKNNSFPGLLPVILQWGAQNGGGPLTSRLFNDLPYPLLQAEHVCVEAIFSIPVAAFAPRDDAHLIPAVVKRALRKKHRVSNSQVQGNVSITLSGNCFWTWAPPDPPRQNIHPPAPGL